MNIGNNIKDLRLKQNLTQNDLATKAKISRVALGQYERGTRYPNIEIINKIAAALNVPIDFLLYDEDDKKRLLTIQNTLKSLASNESFVVHENTEFNDCIEVLKILSNKIEDKKLNQFFQGYLASIPSSKTLYEEDIKNIEEIYNKKINPIIKRLTDTLELEVYKLINKSKEEK